MEAGADGGAVRRPPKRSGGRKKARADAAPPAEADSDGSEAGNTYEQTIHGIVAEARRELFELSKRGDIGHAERFAAAYEALPEDAPVNAADLLEGRAPAWDDTTDADPVPPACPLCAYRFPVPGALVESLISGVGDTHGLPLAFARIWHAWNVGLDQRPETLFCNLFGEEREWVPASLRNVAHHYLCHLRRPANVQANYQQIALQRVNVPRMAPYRIPDLGGRQAGEPRSRH